ncbi:hypothetical protein BGW36DRAFT_431573 [Talaromyces proteolyticus]|uniref:Fumarylacetoacetase-like C-terminal domain-containing protein n=1 Tax=Talaromyces proteolyticus TaxID=1131652 RepID=A0AAD4KIP7_9EURO|nr:uncharacterized protein BGW36DRAFT_431573 [Talaromyces proteolyticus]KAH8692356.1 hypothetical protein BGW36DRAFT_431573 [Talaromyces proteolyticus]
MSKEHNFQRLIRFIDHNGQESHGDLPLGIATDMIEGSTVTLLTGNLEFGFLRTSETGVVTKLLCPLERTNIIHCIGLNYQHHATEAKMTVPKHPVVFTKPADALTGPFDDIHVHPDVQNQIDYEGELTVVIGRDAKNVRTEDALDYVLGYTCGNDVSARDYQVPADISGGQFSYAKSFDQFAPIGPCITSTSVIQDPQTLNYVTKVNGEIRQSTSTADMIWNVKQIIAHLSRGTTLRRGTCIMTGTPSGVGIWMNPPSFLKDGDVITVAIENIGSITNTVVFD